MKRVGLFGGTFDPVHLGHAQIIQAALEEGIEKLIVMPCQISPHKTDALTDPAPIANHHRYKMLQLALPVDERIELSSYEIDQLEISYTWKTLDYLQERFPNDQLCLVIGEDQFNVLEKWAKFEQWCDEIEFLIFRRKNKRELKSNSGKKLRVKWAEQIIADISATKIRSDLAQGRDVSHLLNERVKDYMQQHQLYLS